MPAGPACRQAPRKTPRTTGVSGYSEVGCCSQRPHLPILDHALTGPAYRTAVGVGCGPALPVVADYTRLSAVLGAGRAGRGQASRPPYPGL